MKSAVSAPAAGYRGLIFTALGAGLIVALGAAPAIPLGILPVPVTMQSLGVMLVGLILGPRRAAAAVLVVVALVTMGLPVLAGGRGGLAVLVGPTAGYLYGWIFAALTIGLGAMWSRRLASPLARGLADVLVCVFGGVVVGHACGVIWLTSITGIGWSKALLGTLLFVPGDLVKAVLAVLVATRLEALITIRSD
jgi:biotin transport system substrate-specific component